MKLDGYRYWLVALSLIVIFTCCNRQQTPDVSDIDISINIERWDQQLFELQGKEQIGHFLEANRLFSEHFLHVDQYPHDSMAVNYLYSFLTNPGSGVLREEVSKVFGDLSDLEQEFELAFKYLRHYYPGMKIPSIYSAITGFAGNDLYVSDSVIIVGLDYYLGENATFRPLEFPQYVLKRYRSEYILPSTVLLLSSGLNKTDLEDNSMLAEMIYYGKAYHFTKQILPETTDSLLIGYSGEDLLNVTENEDIIWAHFVEKQLLFENSHFIKKKYMDERPKTLEIGDKCPGRIGEWLGWEIVNRYVDEEGVDLPTLMQTSNAQEIFMQSKYKPQAP